MWCFGGQEHLGGVTVSSNIVSDSILSGSVQQSLQCGHRAKVGILLKTMKECLLRWVLQALDFESVLKLETDVQGV